MPRSDKRDTSLTHEAPDGDAAGRQHSEMVVTARTGIDDRPDDSSFTHQRVTVHRVSADVDHRLVQPLLNQHHLLQILTTNIDLATRICNTHIQANLASYPQWDGK